MIFGMKRLVAVTIIILVCLVSFSACKTNDTTEGFALGTFYSITASGNIKAEDIQAVLDDVENIFSVNIEDSDIYKINNGEAGVPIEVSDDTKYLLSKAIDYSECDYCKNAFNPAIFPLIELWGFNPPYIAFDNKTPPNATQIAAAKALCNINNFTINGNTVTKSNTDSKLDLGGIAKGYAADLIAKYIKNQGINKALINVGGTILSYGKDSVIGITPPRDSPYGYVASFNLPENFACATSGDYERYFDYNDIRYHHIIGQDGYPASSGLIAVTVIAESAETADALSTMIFVEGREKAEEILSYYNAQAILITEDKELIVINTEIDIKDDSYVLID